MDIIEKIEKNLELMDDLARKRGKVYERELLRQNTELRGWMGLSEKVEVGLRGPCRGLGKKRKRL